MRPSQMVQPSAALLTTTPAAAAAPSRHPSRHVQQLQPNGMYAASNCGTQSGTPDGPNVKRPRHGSSSGASSDGSYNPPVTPAGTAAAAGTTAIESGGKANDNADKPTGVLGSKLSGTLNNNVPGCSTPSPASVQAAAAAAAAGSNGMMLMMQPAVCGAMDAMLMPSSQGFSVAYHSGGQLQGPSSVAAPSLAGADLVFLLQQQVQQLQGQNTDLYSRLQIAEGAKAAAQLTLQHTQQQCQNLTVQLNETRRTEAKLNTELQNARKLLRTAKQESSTLHAEKAALEVVLDFLRIPDAGVTGAAGAASSLTAHQQHNTQHQQLCVPSPAALQPQHSRAAFAAAQPSAVVPRQVGQSGTTGALLRGSSAQGVSSDWLAPAAQLTEGHQGGQQQLGVAGAYLHLQPLSGMRPDQAAAGRSEAWQVGGRLAGPLQHTAAPTSAAEAVEGAGRHLQTQGQAQKLASDASVLGLSMEDIVDNTDMFGMGFMPPLSPSDLGF